MTIEKIGVFSILGQLVKTFEPHQRYFVSGLPIGNYKVKITISEAVLSKTLVIE